MSLGPFDLKFKKSFEKVAVDFGIMFGLGLFFISIF